MAVSSINNNNGSGGNTPGNNAADLSNQFMSMLVAQMKNQDPTNPMDNNQLTSQLAQFNMASGIQNLNQSVTEVQGMMQYFGSMSASSWIGRSVMIEGEPKVSFGNGGIGIQQEGVEQPGKSDDFSFVLASDAETVTVTLTDDEGNAYTAELKNVKSGVKTYNLDDLENFKPEPGPPQDREYTLTLKASNPEGEEPIITGLIQEQVKGVTMTGNGAVLHLLNHEPIGMGDVVVIKE